MLESFAEYYSAELSQKVKRGQKESRIKGLFTGGRTPYGYDKENQRLKINESEANIVRDMFNDYLFGMRIKDIVVKIINLKDMDKELRSKGYIPNKSEMINFAKINPGATDQLRKILEEKRLRKKHKQLAMFIVLVKSSFSHFER